MEVNVCSVCGGSTSHQGNKLLRCDSCASHYHQNCHEPRVENTWFDNFSDSDWNCGACKNRLESALEMGATGQNLSVEQKRLYLRSLPKQHLTELLLFCERQHPDLPFYSPTAIRRIIQETQLAQYETEARYESPTSNNNNNNNNNNSSSSNIPLILMSHHNAEHARRNHPQIGMHSRDSSSASAYDMDLPSYPSGDLPSYEDMIAQAITALDEPKGSPPKSIWEWMNKYVLELYIYIYIYYFCSNSISNYPLNPKFKASASQALQKAYKKGRFLKHGTAYTVNTEFDVAAYVSVDIKQ